MNEIARNRLDRQAWIDAAYRILVEHGVARVLVLPLAQELGVTRGSFYWHFNSRAELLDALLDLWQSKNTKALVTAARDPGRTFEQRYIDIARCWLDLSLYDPKLDLAVRDWARSDANVMERVRRDDDVRLEAIAGAFRDAGEGPQMAFIRARVLYYMQMGYYMTGVQEPIETRIDYFADYYQVFTGRRLDADTLARTMHDVRALTGAEDVPKAGQEAS